MGVYRYVYVCVLEYMYIYMYVHMYMYMYMYIFERLQQTLIQEINIREVFVQSENCTKFRNSVFLHTLESFHQDPFLSKHNIRENLGPWVTGT